MHEKVIPEGGVALLTKLEKLHDPKLDGWTLAGGTGLAFQLGHRISEDFDFFRTDDFDVPSLHKTIGRVGGYETLQEAKDTLTVIVEGVKISFFVISDPFIFDGVRYKFFAVADIRDIALMKLIAISGRGSRKDFVDLFTILRGEFKLRECFDLLNKKYSSGRANAYHILKSLTYFDDAETEPMPRMLEPFDWDECKKFFVRETHSIVLPAG